MTTNETSFQYDVFLSHSTKDKAVVRPLAERLRPDGRIPKAKGQRLKAEFEFQPLAFSLQHFCCAPLNQERRFIPLRLDDASNKGSLAQFLYISIPAEIDERLEYSRVPAPPCPSTISTTAQVKDLHLTEFVQLGVEPVREFDLPFGLRLENAPPKLCLQACDSRVKSANGHRRALAPADGPRQSRYTLQQAPWWNRVRASPHEDR
jgi:hypothetical protein